MLILWLCIADTFVREAIVWCFHKGASIFGNKSSKVVRLYLTTLFTLDEPHHFYTALYSSVCQKACRINVLDVKVQDAKNSRYFDPDLVISCNADIVALHR